VLAAHAGTMRSVSGSVNTFNSARAPSGCTILPYHERDYYAPCECVPACEHCHNCPKHTGKPHAYGKPRMGSFKHTRPLRYLSKIMRTSLQWYMATGLSLRPCVMYLYSTTITTSQPSRSETGNLQESFHHWQRIIHLRHIVPFLSYHSLGPVHPELPRACLRLPTKNLSSAHAHLISQHIIPGPQPNATEQRRSFQESRGAFIHRPAKHLKVRQRVQFRRLRASSTCLKDLVHVHVRP